MAVRRSAHFLILLLDFPSSIRRNATSSVQIRRIITVFTEGKVCRHHLCLLLSKPTRECLQVALSPDLLPQVLQYLILPRFFKYI